MLIFIFLFFYTVTIMNYFLPLLSWNDKEILYIWRTGYTKPSQLMSLLSCCLQYYTIIKESDYHDARNQKKKSPQTEKDISYFLPFT